ncbi:DNA primase, partial [Xanthomonas vasicola pv. vasculorum NCPPB 895]
MMQAKIDVEQLKATVDLVAVVERYVQLRRAGKEFAGLCPFHNEH